jgi:hypothetical protein
MSQAVKRKLVVCGGSGFLGKFNPPDTRPA